MRAIVLGIALAAAGLGAACTTTTKATVPPPAPVARRAHVSERHVVAGHDWDKLGERWVDGRVDTDVIDVGFRDGRFHGLLLTVEESALELFDLRVVFADGSVFEPRTRLVFAEHSRSREIDLPGEARVIRRVEFRYGNLPGGGRARVELWGR